MEIRFGRRAVLAAAAGLLAASAGVRGQDATRLRRIAYVSPSTRGPRNVAFTERLAELGYHEGRNLRIDYRFADGRSERLPALVAEVAGLDIELLVVATSLGARAARDAGLPIPVVFAGASDPVAAGVVSNLARPDGNLTGTSLAIGEGSAAKWLELLKEAVPGLARVAVLRDATNAPSARFIDGLRTAAGALQVRLDVRHAANAADLELALTAFAAGDAQGLIVTPDPFASASRERLVGFATSRRLPAVYFDDVFVEAGGLMSYGPSFVGAYRRAADYVDRILRGARPRDLPIEQPTTLELVVNLKAALAIGLSLPQSLLVRADRVMR